MYGLRKEAFESEAAYREAEQLIFKMRQLEGLLNLLSFGTGSPENVVTAPRGALYMRTDGGASTTLYVKTANTDNTGWTAK